MYLLENTNFGPHYFDDLQIMIALKSFIQLWQEQKRT